MYNFLRVLGRNISACMKVWEDATENQKGGSAVTAVGSGCTSHVLESTSAHMENGTAILAKGYNLTVGALIMRDSKI